MTFLLSISVKKLVCLSSNFPQYVKTAVFATLPLANPQIKVLTDLLYMKRADAAMAKVDRSIPFEQKKQ